MPQTFERDDVVQIRGRVKLYNGQKELTLEQIVPAAERDYDLGDFLPHTKYDVEKLYARAARGGRGRQESLAQAAAGKRGRGSGDRAEAEARARGDDACITRFSAGLLEHVVSLIGLARAVAAHYPELDADLLLAGIVLHDIGKIDELRYERGIDYSTEGRLLGHIMIGARLVREKIKAIPGFPPPLAILVEHLILSHHGSLRIRLAVAAADARSHRAAFSGRYGFENGGDARDSGTARRADGRVDRAQSRAAPRAFAHRQIFGRRG